VEQDEFMPLMHTRKDTIRLTGPAEEYFSLPVHYPQKMRLTIDTIRATSIFLRPGDTLAVEIDFTKAVRDWVKPFRYSGKSAAASDYYLNKENHFRQVLFTNLKGMLTHSEPDLSSYQKKIDSLTKIELEYLKTYKPALPQWFRDYEEQDIRYFTAFMKLNSLVYRQAMGMKDVIPHDYHAFRTNTPLNNPKARFSAYYYFYLLECFSNHLRADTTGVSKLKNSPAGTNSIYVPHLVSFREQSKSVLNKEVQDYFTIFQLGLNRPKNTAQVKQAIGFIDSTLHDKTLARYVKGELEKLKTRVLRAGDKAPNFYLVNEQNSLLSLDQFKGNVVYIGFWFAGCKPCLKEFPLENELVEKYKSDPVKIVSICVTTPKETWKQYVKKYGLKTANLYTNNQWLETLVDRYHINSYPHYVLLDKEGRIIENYTKRPSEGVATLIDRYK
jgi:thiol-disulfide isomerase/thioredoxin